MTPSLMIQTAAQLCPILDGATPKIYQYKIYVALSLLILLDCLSWWKFWCLGSSNLEVFWDQQSILASYCITKPVDLYE